MDWILNCVRESIDPSELSQIRLHRWINLLKSFNPARCWLMITNDRYSSITYIPDVHQPISYALRTKARISTFMFNRSVIITIPITIRQFNRDRFTCRRNYFMFMMYGIVLNDCRSTTFFCYYYYAHCCVCHIQYTDKSNVWRLTNGLKWNVRCTKNIVRKSWLFSSQLFLFRDFCVCFFPFGFFIVSNTEKKKEKHGNLSWGQILWLSSSSSH